MCITGQTGLGGQFGKKDSALGKGLRKMTSKQGSHYVT